MTAWCVYIHATNTPIFPRATLHELWVFDSVLFNNRFLCMIRMRENSLKKRDLFAFAKSNWIWVWLYTEGILHSHVQTGKAFSCPLELYPIYTKLSYTSYKGRWCACMLHAFLCIQPIMYKSDVFWWLHDNCVKGFFLSLNHLTQPGLHTYSGIQQNSYTMTVCIPLHWIHRQIGIWAL